jgi:hypothetical protein
VTGPRSRRARVGHTARSRKGSVAAEGTSILPTVLPFARRHPKWILAGAKPYAGSPDPVHDRAGDPGARSATRRARAKLVREARVVFTRTFRPAACLVQVVARRPSARKRVERPTQPASVGAGAQRGESSTRVRGSKARRVCPRVVSRLQKSASVAEAQRSAYPVASERVDGSLADKGPRGPVSVKRRRHLVSRWPSHGASEGRSRALERASRGEGSCPHGRHLGPLHPHAPLHAGERAAVSATLTPVSVATGVSEARPHTSRREDNAPRDDEKPTLCGPPKRITLA